MRISFQRGSEIHWPGCTRCVVQLGQSHEQTVEEGLIKFDNLPLEQKAGFLNDRCTVQIHEGSEMTEVNGVFRRVHR